MEWGFANRLSRIIQPKSRRVVMLAVDHGFFLGPTTGLEDPKAALDPIIPYADTIMVTRGVLRASVDPVGAPPVMLRVSGGTSILTELSHELITTSIQDAVRLNVAGITCSIFIGAPHERQSLANLAQIVNEGHDHGIPVMAVTAVGKDMVRDSRYLGLSCRIAAELGASIVKTYYCDDFTKIVSSCPVPIVIAGGKKIPEKDALEVAYKAINDGAVGVDMGRNIFQAEDPAAMIQAVRAVVHENYTPDQAYKLLLELKKQA